MATLPYAALDPMQTWPSIVDEIARGAIDPQGSVRFTIEPHMKIASAGSCFAGRLADVLRADGGQYFVAEPAPDGLTPEQETAHGYRPFSARYGLVYTSLQLYQLFERAFERFVPCETFWTDGARFIDPFRPRSSPGGYASVAELLADRASHFAAVRSMFSQIDIFLFTLGLTEYWFDRRDGAVFPYCPGVAGGTFDASRHAFHNATVAETIASMNAFLSALRAINPTVRVILSVSPIPIGATIDAVHVVRASAYTKSVLRVAVEELYREHDFVDYFAGYEMISQAFYGIDPFLTDRRHLRPGIVEVVVANFRSHFLAPSIR